MTSLIREKDTATADAFFAKNPDMGEMLDKYPECLDPEISRDSVSLGCYLHYRETGMDHSFAAMQACRRGPRSKGSDRGFNEHARSRMNSMSPRQMEKVLKRAQSAGVRTQGKFYVGPLADRRGPGDPRAWVSTVEEIRSVVRDRNYEATGCVEHRSSERPPAPRVALADDLTQEFVRRRLKEDPSARERVRRSPKKELGKLREEIVATHGRRR